MNSEPSKRAEATKITGVSDGELSLENSHEEAQLYGTAKSILDQGFANLPA